MGHIDEMPCAAVGEGGLWSISVNYLILRDVDTGALTLPMLADMFVGGLFGAVTGKDDFQW